MPSFRLRSASLRSCDTRDSVTPRKRAEEAGQFLRGLTLEEVADDHQTLPLGQQLHGIPEVVVQFPGLELLGRLDGVVVAQDVDEGQILVGVGAGLVIECQHDGAEQPVPEPGQLVLADTEGLRRLVDVGQATQFAGQLLLGRLQPPGQQPHRAWRPVGGPHRIENRPSDSLSGESFERHPSVLVVAAGRFDQTERTGPGQLLAVDVAGEVHGDLVDDVLDQRQVRFDTSVERCPLLPRYSSWVTHCVISPFDTLRGG